jgi:hypothetical protein
VANREELLQKLIIGGHVNVHERHSLDVVGRREVAKIVKSLLLRQGRFPGKRPTTAVYEGATMFLLPGGVRITWQRAYASDPFNVAQSRTEDFENIDLAVEAYIRSEWSAGIDGIALGNDIARAHRERATSDKQ